MLEKADWKFILKWKLRILLGNLDFRRKNIKWPILLLLYRLGVEDGWQGNAYTVVNLDPYYGKHSHIKRQTDRYIDQLSVCIRGEVVIFGLIMMGIQIILVESG